MANLEYYKVFYYVAEYHNMTLAAEKLYLNQSNVSRIISNLEAETGGLLFTRHRNGVQLTERGNELYVRIKDSLKTILDADEEYSGFNRLKTSEINIGTGDYFSEIFIKKEATHYLRGIKGLDINCMTIDRQYLLATLKSEIVDCIFQLDKPTSLGVPYPACEELEQEIIMTVRDIPVVGNGLLELSKKKLTLDDIDNLPILISSDTESKRHYLKILTGKTMMRQSDISSDWITLMDFIKKGYGLGFIPYVIAEEYIQKQIMFPVKIEIDCLSRHLWKITRKGSKISDELRGFIKSIKACNIYEKNN